MKQISLATCNVEIIDLLVTLCKYKVGRRKAEYTFPSFQNLMFPKLLLTQFNICFDVPTVCSPSQVDLSPLCASYKMKGYCKLTSGDHQDFMEENCVVTCGNCRGKLNFFRNKRMVLMEQELFKKCIKLLNCHLLQ